MPPRCPASQQSSESSANTIAATAQARRSGDDGTQTGGKLLMNNETAAFLTRITRPAGKPTKANRPKQLPNRRTVPAEMA